MINIPLTNQPNQIFSMSIPQNAGNVRLSFRAYWNEIAEYWQLDIADDATSNVLILGLPLLPTPDPAQNLLRQWEYLGMGNAYVVPLSTATTDSPGINDWGTNFILLWDTSGS